MKPLVDGHIPQAGPRETGGFYAIGDTNVNPIRQIQGPTTGSNCPEWNPFSDFPGPKCLSNQDLELFASPSFIFGGACVKHGFGPLEGSLDPR